MLRLRPFRKNDAKKIITWSNEEEAFYKWSAGILGTYPVTEDRMIIATSGRDDNDKYFPFTAFDENGPVGFFTLRVFGEANEEVRFGFVIVDSRFRGKGYGKQMILQGLKFAFEIYGAKKATLGVFDNNMQAYYCYKSVGFKETGEIEQYNINDSVWKCINMAIEK